MSLKGKNSKLDFKMKTIAPWKCEEDPKTSYGLGESVCKPHLKKDCWLEYMKNSESLWVGDTKSHFTDKDAQMTNKHTKIL